MTIDQRGQARHLGDGAHRLFRGSDEVALAPSPPLSLADLLRVGRAVGVTTYRGKPEAAMVALVRTIDAQGAEL